MKTKNKTMSDLGEFGLINHIKKYNTKPKKNHNVFLDIGDDCFVYNFHKNAKYVVTADILIENIHFKTGWSTPEHIGQKAMEVNVSDIASMGTARPLYAFVCAGLPKNISENFVKKLFGSIKKTCNKYDIHLAGGDTVRAEDITISVTLIGICYDNPVTRNGAEKGDFIFVSGTFGDSGAGFDAINNEKNKTAYEKILIKKHLVPEARLKLANDMTKKIKITSMTDASDGLYKSAELLCENKGAVINMQNIPVSENLKKYCKNDLKKIYNFALFGGEDFELVFTVDKRDKEKAEKLFGGKIKCIGYVTDDKKIKYYMNNKLTDLKYDGYKHF